MHTRLGRLRPGLATASLLAALGLLGIGAALLPEAPAPPVDQETPASSGGQAAEQAAVPEPVLALPTFTVVDATFNSGLYTSMRTAPDGLPALTYYEDTNGALRYVRCLDPACADTTATVVDDDGVTGLSTSLAYDADGMPVISYYDLGAGAVHVAWCQDADCRRSQRVLVDAAVPDVTRTALTIAPDGRAEVAYAAGPTTDAAELQLARCDRATCERERLDGPAIGEYVASSRHGDDLVIVYRDEAGRKLRVATCTTADGCTVGSPDTTVGAGLQPSVVVAADGTTLVAHLDLAGGELRLLRCPDPTCATGETTILADTAGAGFFPAVALRADGTPTVAYYDEATRALWLATCIDPACSDVRRNVVDALGIVGLHTAMILGEDGVPLIAYHDQTNRQLKVAGCANVACDAPIEAATLGGGITSFVDGEGRPGMVYRSARPRDIRMVRCTDRACDRTEVTAADSRSFVGLHGGGSLTADGTPLVTFVDTAGADLRLGTCSEETCAYLEARDLAAAGNVGTFAVQSLDGDRLAVAHLDRSRGQVRLLTCTAPACVAPDEVAVADVGEGAGQLGVAHLDGRPLLLHHDPTTGELRLTACADAACGDRQDAIVARGAAPVPVALEIDAEGRPWMLHRDAASGALQVTTCADPSCAAPRTLTLADGGVEASLGLADGRPVVAFLEEGRGLVLARCTEAGCAETTSVVLSTQEGLTTSLTIGTGGEVLVGSLELATGSPVLLRCPDPSCSEVERISLLGRAGR